LLDWLKYLSHSEHLYGLSLVWTLMWVFRSPDLINALSHCEHLYGLSPVWILTWVIRDTDTLNALSHMWHLYGLSLVWTLMWMFRLTDSINALNALSHSAHLYGFSPLWILLCTTRWGDCLNRLLQTVHLNGFSPEWLCPCTVNSLLPVKHFPHSLHLYLLLWTFMCIFKYFWLLNCFSHCVHEYNLSSVCLMLAFDWIFSPVNWLNSLQETSQWVSLLHYWVTERSAKNWFELLTE